MSSLSSVEIRLNAGAPACVLDASLALSSGGLLLATRLAREWPVWLVRSMWPMIDSDQLYRERPHLVAAAGEPRASVDQLISALGDWHVAWLGDRVKGRFHWIGDHRHESDIPEDADECLLARFEALANSLLRRTGDSDDEAIDEWSWRRTSACEALALAAALQTRPTVVLTLAEPGTRPGAVELWEEFTGVECPALEVNGTTPFALPASLRIGLPPLLDGAARLAAIHIAAPRALSLPWGVGGVDLWGETDPGFLVPNGPAPDPWDGATLVWHPVS
jgi:hypothetical protein